MAQVSNDKLYEIISPAVEASGCILWGIECRPHSKRSVLRVYIDNENGVSLEDCSQASRQVSAVLDVEDPIDDSYTLEVSSPGINRRLFFFPQYREYCGKKLTVQLHTDIDGRRKFSAKLVEVGQQLKFNQDGELFTIDFEDCSQISRQASAVLDVEDPIDDGHTLEVSSPDIDRRLFSLSQYREYCGEKLTVQLHTDIDGRRKFSATLVEVERQLKFSQDGELFTIDFEDVTKAYIDL